MKLNINDYVRVKLTPEGRRIIQDNMDRLNRLLPRITKLDPITRGEDADGWSKWQLWELMHEFGAKISLGCRVPFETTIDIQYGSLSAGPSGTERRCDGESRGASMSARPSVPPAESD